MAEEVKSESSKMGRPTLYSSEIANEICDAIAENLKGLKTLCSLNPHWPKPRTIRTWIRERSDFQHMYTLAKEDQTELMAEEILEISDDSSHDTLVKQNSQGEEYEVCNYEWINRARLRVDSRKWIASKLLPKKFGDRISEDPNQGLNALVDKLSKVIVPRDQLKEF